MIPQAVVTFLASETAKAVVTEVGKNVVSNPASHYATIKGGEIIGAAAIGAISTVGLDKILNSQSRKEQRVSEAVQMWIASEGCSAEEFIIKMEGDYIYRRRFYDWLRSNGCKPETFERMRDR